MCVFLMKIYKNIYNGLFDFDTNLIFIHPSETLIETKMKKSSGPIGRELKFMYYSRGRARMILSTSRELSTAEIIIVCG